MRKRVGVGIVMLVLLVDRPNQAEAGAFATEITQVLNHGQLVMGYIRQGQELANALDMYREQIRNGLALPSHFFHAIQSDLTSLAGIVQGGQALAYSLGNLDSQFRTTFTGYGTNSNVYFTPVQELGNGRTGYDSRHAPGRRASGFAALVRAGRAFGSAVPGGGAERRRSGHTSDDGHRGTADAATDETASDHAG